MGSYNAGKNEIITWIREHFNPEATILDVGVCDGKWKRLLKEYNNMDGIDIFHPNAERSAPLYRTMYSGDIYDLRYDYYDLVIFGDVIEHMTVERAQAVLEYAKQHCSAFIVGVPWLYEQGPCYGNPFEKHIQSDLTGEVFKDRYPGLELLLQAADDYCYFLYEYKPKVQERGKAQEDTRKA